MYANGYQNHELVPVEAEFQTQLNRLAQTGRLSQQQINYIASVWEQQKYTAYAAARQKLNAPLIGSALANFVQGFINIAIQQMTNTPPMPTCGFGMPTTMTGTPYLAQGFGMPQPSPFAGVYQPMQGITYNPQGSMILSEQPKYANLPQQQVVTQQHTQRATETTKEEQKVLQIKKVDYAAPVVEDNDTAYGNDEHHTAIGSIKVIAMRDCYGIPFKQVLIRLNTPCRNKLEALNQARLIYKDKGIAHIEIQYDLAVTLGIAYDKGKKVIASIKKAFPKSTAAANQLKYVQSIQKILDDESRGVANVIEEFLIDRFNYVAATGCVASDYNGEFTIESLRALINLSDKDCADSAINAWQAKPGFMTALVNCTNNTIKKDLINCEVLDPSVQKDFRTIIRHFTGLTESDEGKLVDVGMELLPKEAEFCKSTQKEKMTNFGAAGEIVAGSTTILLKNQHLVVTDLVPEETMGYTSTHDLCVAAKTLILGGYTNDEPNTIDSNFEYMLIKSSLGEDYWVDIIVNYENKIHCTMKCVPSIDRWLVVSPSKF